MFLTASATAILGCATPNAVVYSPVNTPPRAFVRRTPASVEMFVGKPPTRPHVDVGMFEVYQGRRTTAPASRPNRCSPRCGCMRRCAGAMRCR